MKLWRVFNTAILAVLVHSLIFAPVYAVEQRKVTQPDIEWGPSTDNVTSSGGHVGKKIPRFWDNNAFTDNLTLYGKGIILSNRTTHADNNGVIYKGANTFAHDFTYGNNGTVTTLGNNTFFGMDAGNLTMGATATETWHSSWNTGIGVDTLYYNTTGGYNTAIGAMALALNTAGNSNVGLGMYSLYRNATGSGNIGIGQNAGANVLGGGLNDYPENSIYIGINTLSLSGGATNEIVIGANAVSGGSNSVVLGDNNIADTYLKGRIHLSSIKGTEAADNAATGYIGEYLDNTIIYSGRKALTTATALTVASLTLYPGDWDVTGMVKFDMAATTSVTKLVGGTSFVDNNWENNDATNSQRFFPTAGQDNSAWDSESIVIPTRRVSISSITTIYMFAYAVFTASTANAYGFISARRAR